MADEELETFDTGGRLLGYVGIVAALGAVVVYLTHLRDPDPLPLPLLTGSIFAAVLLWAVIVRPRVRAGSETLVLVNVLETVHIPMAAVRDHVLRQVLAVRAGDRRYVATGVGRNLKALRPKGVRPDTTRLERRLRGGSLGLGAGSAMGPGAGMGMGTGAGAGRESVGQPAAGAERVVDAADFAEARIDALARAARDRAGVERHSEEQLALGAAVRRERAWLVVAALAGSLVLFVGTLLV